MPIISAHPGVPWQDEQLRKRGQAVEVAINRNCTLNKHENRWCKRLFSQGPYKKVAICPSAFLLISGTNTSFAGYPATSNKNGRSCLGRSSILFKNPIGPGVCVSVARPACCGAIKAKSPVLKEMADKGE